MSNLYQEAIADAKRLKEVAEQNAKNRIVDAITPRLRQMIERQLLEGDEFVDDLDTDLMSADDDLDLMSDPADDIVGDDLGTEEIGDVSITDAEPISDDGFGSLEVVDDLEEESESEESGNKPVNINITVEGKKLRSTAVKLVRMLSEAKTQRQRNKIRRRLNEVRKRLLLIENNSNKRLAQNIAVILKESKMSKRRNWLFEGDEFGKDGAPAEEIEFDDAGMEDEGDVDVDAVKSAIEDLAAAVGLEVGGDAEMDDEDLDFDSEDEDFDMKDGGMGKEMNFDDLDFEDEELEEGDMYEVSESMLRRAVRGNRRSSRRLSESQIRRRRMARRRRLAEGEAKAMAKHFGGGTAGKEMFIEVSEEQLLNALEKELGRNYPNMAKNGGQASAKASAFGGGSVQKGVVPESRRRTARQLSEAKRRAQAAERKAVAAQKELKESNTFNAKLLYVTKLMQQHNLNQKQQRAIVEAMDNAKTIREAKLLYTKLNESLTQRLTESKSQTKTVLTENRSSTGSSSRSLQSSAPAKNGVELDRWAKLAGLNK